MNNTRTKDEDLKGMVESVNKSGLSSIKQTVSSIIDVINNRKATIKDLQDIIEIDPPLTVKLLKIANSAYYTTRQPVHRIKEAVLRIGFDMLKEMALCQKLFEIYNDEVEYRRFSRISLWKHSVAVALLGKMIFRMEFREKGDNIYTAGLLHEIGIISEDQLRYNDFKKILELAVAESINLTKAETRILGFHHAELGQAIATHWKLPKELVITLGYHHDPDSAPKEYSKIVSTLYVADYLCQEQKIGYCDSPYNNKEIYKRCLKRLNMEPYVLDLIVENMKEKLLEMETQGLL